MALPARFTLLHSDLNDFLFAAVGQEQNGMPLSVVSALTRLGVDPWEEAARLAVMPKALAAEALAPIIARLSPAPLQSGDGDNVAIVRQLVGLLPTLQQLAKPSRQRTGAWENRYSQAVMLLICLGLGAAIFFTLL
jgi:hypothetical protein